MSHNFGLTMCFFHSAIYLNQMYCWYLILEPHSITYGRKHGKVDQKKVLQYNETMFFLVKGLKVVAKCFFKLGLPP